MSSLQSFEREMEMAFQSYFPSGKLVTPSLHALQHVDSLLSPRLGSALSRLPSVASCLGASCYLQLVCLCFSGAGALVLC